MDENRLEVEWKHDIYEKIFADLAK